MVSCREEPKELALPKTNQVSTVAILVLLTKSTIHSPVFFWLRLSWVVNFFQAALNWYKNDDKLKLIEHI